MKIIQIGVAQGDDHVTELVKNKKLDLLLLVEGNPLNIQGIKECYQNHPNHIIENLAICSPWGFVPKDVKIFYSTDNGPQYGVSSLDINHILKHNFSRSSIKHFTVKCMPLRDLLHSYNISDLDYLFLDIEGLDAEISLSFNPSEFNIKNIQIEVLHLGNKKDEVINHFINHGYSKTEALGSDIQCGVEGPYDIMFTKN